MPSSFSANLRLEKQFTGENINVWGDKLDATIDRLDDAIAGYVAIAVTGDYTLSSSNSNTTADEARRALLKFTGTLSANATITLPSVSKTYGVWNATNKALTFTLGSGSTVVVDSGDKCLIWSDGTNVNDSLFFGGLRLKDWVAAMTASAGAVPGVTGNAGKYLYTDGVNAFWRQPSTADLSDYNTLVLGVQVALAVAL
jgi:hypothetical protein